MENPGIDYILNSYVGLPHSFTIQEVLDFIDKNIDPNLIRESFINDSRFIRLSIDGSSEYQFISKITFFQWLVNLNIRFAKVCLFKLTETQLTYKMNQLRYSGQWDSPSVEAIQWGRSLGLISPCCTTDEYVFPLAWILSFMSPIVINFASDILNDFSDNEISHSVLKTQLEIPIEKYFSEFDERAIYIIKHRLGFYEYKKKTLEKLSKYLGITRERVRQIETKFKNKFFQRSQKDFIKAFLCDFMHESGSLVVSIDSPRMFLRKFLAECIGITPIQLLKIGLLILTDSSKPLFSLKKLSRLWNEQAEEIAVAKLLESNGKLFFNDTDIKIISERIVQWFRRRLKRAQRVYLALRTIGKPAHYSQVTEVHNELFSELPATEHTVHAVLSDQQYGIVWVGVRGTFALKEWGYKRPSRTLFNSVTEIVNKIYRQTGKPTPYTVIMSEIGKHRKLLNPSSIYIATHLNPDLKRISKELFVPKGRKDLAKAKDETSSDKLDKILQKFQGKQ